jgi:hypothetical protein
MAARGIRPESKAKLDRARKTDRQADWPADKPVQPGDDHGHALLDYMSPSIADGEVAPVSGQ